MSIRPRSLRRLRPPLVVPSGWLRPIWERQQAIAVFGRCTIVTARGRMARVLARGPLTVEQAEAVIAIVEGYEHQEARHG